MFLGSYKYWMMSNVENINLDDVLNRAPPYRDRRDFDIRLGDTGTR
ncbi:MAG: hypothetical protein OXC55_08490 [Chloroflexi bacterium]|nr:hypothetical protein [Chloroflexota bacterium]